MGSNPEEVKTERVASRASAPGAAGSSSPEKRARKRRLDVNPELILSTEGRSKRRRTPSPDPQAKDDPDPKDAERAKHLGLQLYHKISAMRDSDGESMAEPFVKLPNKRQFPDYYETIKHPMSLDMVKEKLDKAQYDTLNDVCNDMSQIWNNAKRYNMRESLIFQWAKKMHKVTRTFYNNHTADHDGSESEAEEEHEPTPQRKAPPSRAAASRVSTEAPSPAGPSTPMSETPVSTPRAHGGPGTGKKRGSYMKDGPTVYKLIKPCMRAIKEARSDDGENRDVAAIFLQLPDRRQFPDYYREIKNPISLNDIEQRMFARRYDSADAFFDELDLMCDNAMQYNEDNSEVWRDARQIRDITNQHRELVKERLAMFKDGGKQKSHLTPVRHVPAPSPMAAGYGIPAPTMPQPFVPQQQPPPPMAMQHQQVAQHQLMQQRQQQQQQYHQDILDAQAQALRSRQAFMPQQGSPAPPPPAPQAYLPQLQPGVVTEEIVANLDRYSEGERQMWFNSLPPLAQSIYKQMVAANDARKRGVPAPVPPAQTPKREVLELATTPAVKHIDFAYGTDGANGTVEGARTGAIRLTNHKGLLNHAVLVGGHVSSLQLTAWLDAEGGTPGADKPELSLRVNGTAVPIPKPVFDGDAERPAGMRWTVPVSRVETKIEVIAKKGGARPAETSAIFVNRQF